MRVDAVVISEALLPSVNVACAALAEMPAGTVPLSDDAPGRAFATADDTPAARGNGGGVLRASRLLSRSRAQLIPWPVTIRGWKD